MKSTTTIEIKVRQPRYSFSQLSQKKSKTQKKTHLLLMILFFAFFGMQLDGGTVFSQCLPTGTETVAPGNGAISSPTCAWTPVPNDRGVGQGSQRTYTGLTAGQTLQLYFNNTSAGTNCAQIIFRTSANVDIGSWTTISTNALAPTSITVPAGSDRFHLTTTTNGAWTGNSAILNYRKPNPGAVTVSSGANICSGSSLTASGGAGGTIYWQNTTNNGTSTATPSTSQAVTSAGTYYFSALNATSGCWTQGSSVVTLKPGPTGVDAGPDVTICTGGSVVLNGSVNSIPGFSYSENFNGCDSDNCNGWTISGGYQPGIDTWIRCSNSAANDNIYSARPDSYVRTNNSLFTSNGNLVTFSFSYRTENHSNSASIPDTYCTFKVEWSPDGTNWTTLSTFNNQNNTNCNNHTTTFTPPTGQNVYLRVHAHRNNGDFDFLIDDISVSQSASTPPVSWSGTSIVGGTTLTPTVNPTTTTVYTMTATVNGCSVSDNVTVTVTNPVMTGIFSVCVGETTDLAVTGETDWTTMPTGGTVTTSGNDRIHRFTTSGTFTSTYPISGARVLVVGGGGGGGQNGGGGGGAGQYLYVNNVSLTSGTNATVGAGGSTGGSPAGNGAPSSFGALSAIGGGGGASRDAGAGGQTGASGGGGGGSEDAGRRNGGGASAGNSAGNGIGGGCNSAGGGGGGAGGPGGNASSNNGGAGGLGVQNNISGSNLWYAGGGGGGTTNYCSPSSCNGTPCGSIINGTGGSGVGGNGESTAGAANTGSGGGAERTGGSGVVIVRYAVPKWTVVNGTGSATINAQTGVLTGVTVGTVTVTYRSQTGCEVSQEVTITPTTTLAISNCPSNIIIDAAPGACMAKATWTNPTWDGCISTPIAGADFVGTNGGNHYFYVPGDKTWTAAKADAEAKGGRLATIENVAKNTLLTNYLTSNTIGRSWIGYTDGATEGNYVSVSGVPLSYGNAPSTTYDVYNNWAPGEPNDANTGEDFASIYPAGTWNDLNEVAESGYFLEYGLIQTAGFANGAANFPVGVTTVTYNAYTPAGVSATCSFTVTVNSTTTSSVSIAASPSATICAGTSVTFTATPTNGGASPTYQWKLNGSNVGTNSATYTNSGLTNGQIITCVMTSNATTCMTPVTSNAVTMTVNPNPTATITAISPTPTICHGSTYTISGTATPGSTVNVNNSAGSAVANASGVWTINTIPTATTTYSITSVTIGSCTGTGTGSTSVTLPSTGTNLGNNGDVATCLVNDGNTIHFYEDGRLLASINSNGQNLGNVTVTSYVTAGGTPVSVPACLDPTNPSYITATMGRSWVITPENAPALTPAIDVYLPFNDGEFTTLQTLANNNGNPNDNLAGIANLKLSKYSGTNENGTFTDNCGNGTTNLVGNSGAANITGYYPAFTGSGNYARFGITSFSEFWLHGSQNSPLPVTLTNFSATCDKEVKLFWTTASEQNSDRFIIEKSRDAQEWVAIGEITAAGNSNTTLNYDFTDPNRWNGTSYYRLRQIDFNGEYEVFGPISASCENNNSSLTVYPNPNNGVFTVEISSDEMILDAQLFLTDMTGKIITSQKVNVAVGTTQIMLEDLELEMGTYLVSLRDSNKNIAPVKVVVDR